MKITENGQKIINYLREINNADATAADIAEAIGLTKPQVNGSVNALAKEGKELAYRVEATVKDGDETKTVKFIKLTDAGMTVTYDEN